MSESTLVPAGPTVKPQCGCSGRVAYTCGTCGDPYCQTHLNSHICSATPATKEESAELSPTEMPSISVGDRVVSISKNYPGSKGTVDRVSAGLYYVALDREGPVVFSHDALRIINETEKQEQADGTAEAIHAMEGMRAAMASLKADVAQAVELGSTLEKTASTVAKTQLEQLRDELAIHAPPMPRDWPVIHLNWARGHTMPQGTWDECFAKWPWYYADEVLKRRGD